MKLKILLVLSFCSIIAGQSSDDWRWTYNQNKILPTDLLIPGRAEPTSPRPTHAVPKITTFHPKLSNEDKKEKKTAEKKLAEKPHKSEPVESTTKSRVVEDFVSETNQLDRERYTTLDKLFAERGHYDNTGYEPHPRHLGGLDPREVFYADDNLLILKGGGFPTKIIPGNKLQSIDSSDTHETRVFFPPKHEVPFPLFDSEYNGNIPQIVRPKGLEERFYNHLQPQLKTQNQEGFRKGKSISWPTEHINNNNAKRSSWPLQSAPTSQVPLVYNRRSNINQNQLAIRPQNQKNVQVQEGQVQYVYNPYIKSYVPSSHFTPIRSAPVQQSGHRTPANTVLISLAGDTDVNFLDPRPSRNPFAENLNRNNGHEFQHQSPPILRLHQTRGPNESKPIL